ncbi:MAG: hypothetical protein KZQ83_17795 [gamma proteobacterium symbiont of Taylorina sp.]|nr:hypothetical protein [gamma proteobacterium symbiont of Taylorina sp.]
MADTIQNTGSISTMLADILNQPVDSNQFKYGEAHAIVFDLHQALTSTNPSKYQKPLQERVDTYVDSLQTDKAEPTKQLTTLFSDKTKADELLNRFVDCVETKDIKKRTDKYWKLKGDILIYMLIDQDKGVSS